MPVINSLAERKEEMREWRRELHQHPEICYEEVWTSDFIAAKLQSFGIEVHRGMGKTGVVGVVRGNGDSDRAIGLRADIDALPMQELNEFEHASKIPNRMHACGHDGHTTMLLGAAKYLAETRNFDGTVYLIFQPAEEGGGGGLAMIEDGLFREFDIQTVWGMHNMPQMDMGEAGVHDGVCMANADQFDMTITGRGGHAAQPHLCIDPDPLWRRHCAVAAEHRVPAGWPGGFGGSIRDDFPGRYGKECDCRYRAHCRYGAVVPA